VKKLPNCRIVGSVPKIRKPQLELVSKMHFRLRGKGPQGLKPTIFAALSGTAEAVPYPRTAF
jgi:hypothetical protein